MQQLAVGDDGGDVIDRNEIDLFADFYGNAVEQFCIGTCVKV